MGLQKKEQCVHRHSRVTQQEAENEGITQGSPVLPSQEAHVCTRVALPVQQLNNVHTSQHP